MARLFRQFSFPGGIPSHVAPEVPGSIHEGGELGYSLMHAYGAAFDNPDLMVACVVGDGEAETGPLAGELALQRVPQPGPRRRGAADPAPQRLQDRQPDGAGPDPRGRPARAHARLRLPAVRRGRRRPGRRCTSELAAASTGRWTRSPRSSAGPAPAAPVERPRWPMIVLRTPKGWTGPERGRRQAGRGHLPRPPGAAVRRPRQPGAPGRAGAVAAQLPARRSCSTPTGAPVDELAALPPRGDRRMSANPHANGGVLLRDLVLPDFREYAVTVEHPGEPTSEATRVLGGWVRDVIRRQPATGSGCSARTRSPPTGSAPCSRSPTARSSPPPRPATTTSPPTAG